MTKRLFVRRSGKYWSARYYLIKKKKKKRRKKKRRKCLHMLHFKTLFLENVCWPPRRVISASNVFQWFGSTNILFTYTPQWGAADAEIKVPSGENTELKRSPFKAWSKSVYSHTCYAYCQGILSYLFLHFRSIHLHFFQNLSRFFPVLAVANTWFLCRPAE